LKWFRVLAVTDGRRKRKCALVRSRWQGHQSSGDLAWPNGVASYRKNISQTMTSTGSRQGRVNFST
jgi:hypothetical protein